MGGDWREGGERGKGPQPQSPHTQTPQRTPGNPRISPGFASNGNRTPACAAIRPLQQRTLAFAPFQVLASTVGSTAALMRGPGPRTLPRDTRVCPPTP